MEDTRQPEGEKTAINHRPFFLAMPWRWAFILPEGLLCILLAWLLVFGNYFWSQGLAMAQLWLSAKDVESSLQDPSLAPEDRRFLERTGGIRNFAIHDLGLNGSRNYKTWIKLDRPWVVMAVSACADDRFRQYLWQYPFVGDLPYKGFFTETDARHEFDRLKAEGLDVMMRGVGAFSTLGILPDPLLSSWEGYEDRELADLIIHELTHATVFVPGQGDFNENLASFVGREGARQYMALRQRGEAGGIRGVSGDDSGSKSGGDRAETNASPGTTAVIGDRASKSADSGTARMNGDRAADSVLEDQRRQDDETWTRMLHGLYLDLDQVYRDTGLSRDQKLAIKKWTFERFAANLDRSYSAWFQTPDYRQAVTRRLNNAVIMLYRTYEARQDDFTASFRDQGSDIKAWLAWIKERLAKGEKVPGMAD